jgi:hypothetical protein
LTAGHRWTIDSLLEPEQEHRLAGGDEETRERRLNQVQSARHDRLGAAAENEQGGDEVFPVERGGHRARGPNPLLAAVAPDLFLELVTEVERFHLAGAVEGLPVLLQGPDGTLVILEAADVGKPGHQDDALELTGIPLGNAVVQEGGVHGPVLAAIDWQLPRIPRDGHFFTEQHFHLTSSYA